MLAPGGERRGEAHAGGSRGSLARGACTGAVAGLGARRARFEARPGQAERAWVLPASGPDGIYDGEIPSIPKKVHVTQIRTWFLHVSSIVEVNNW